MEKLFKLLQSDKVLHFLAGFLFGIFGVDFNLSISVFVGKEVFDTIKPNQTGFSLEDIAADLGGYCFGVFVRGLIIDML